MNKLAPSILAADFNKLGEQISLVKQAGAEYLHVDVMDGVFVPSISFGMPVIESIRKETDIIFDCHLMIVDPERYIDTFAGLGADIITVHYEACKDVRSTLEHIRSMGLKVGLTINPETPVEVVYDYLELTDMVLIMSVHPGFGGQSFIEDSLKKISALREYLDANGFTVDIEVDGGIKASNVKKVLEAGANVIVAGSAVFGGDIVTNISQFKAIMNG